MTHIFKKKVEAPKGKFKKPFMIMTDLKRMAAGRRSLIRDVVQAWINTDRHRAAKFAKFLHEITKVEHSGGEWRDKNGFCKLRLPQELFTTLRRAFNEFLPGEAGFADEDSDVQLLYEEFPKLLPPPRVRKDR